MTPSLDARLDAYPDLPPDERASLKAQIAADRPDLIPVLEDTVTVARLLDGLREGGEAIRVAELAAARATGTASPAEDAAWSRLEARGAEDPAQHDRMAAVEARIFALGAALQDPQARLARLMPQGTGAGPQAPVSSRRAERTPMPGARRGVPRWGRALVAVAALVLLLGGLRFVLRTSPYAFTAEEVGAEEFGALRGEYPATVDPVETRYLEALGDLAGAQRRVLGWPLAPNRTRLADAAQQLEEVVQASVPGSFVRLEAAYRLAKARLLLGDAAAARPLLDEVVEGQGRYAPEAAALLEDLGTAE